MILSLVNFSMVIPSYMNDTDAAIWKQKSPTDRLVALFDCFSFGPDTNDTPRYKKQNVVDPWFFYTFTQTLINDTMDGNSQYTHGKTKTFYGAIAHTKTDIADVESWIIENPVRKNSQERLRQSLLAYYAEVKKIQLDQKIQESTHQEQVAFAEKDEAISSGDPKKIDHVWKEQFDAYDKTFHQKFDGTGNKVIDRDGKKVEIVMRPEMGDLWEDFITTDAKTVTLTKSDGTVFRFDFQARRPLINDIPTKEKQQETFANLVLKAKGEIT